MDPPQTPPPPNFSQKPKFHIFVEAFPNNERPYSAILALKP